MAEPRLRRADVDILLVSPSAGIVVHGPSFGLGCAHEDEAIISAPGGSPSRHEFVGAGDVEGGGRYVGVGQDSVIHSGLSLPPLGGGWFGLVWFGLAQSSRLSASLVRLPVYVCPSTSTGAAAVQTGQRLRSPW